jgi:hypothetical protein
MTCARKALVCPGVPDRRFVGLRPSIYESSGGSGVIKSSVETVRFSCVCSSKL